MMELGTTLKHVAFKYGASVVVTNGTVASGRHRGSRKPALGRSWESVPSVRLWLHGGVDNDDNEQHQRPRSRRQAYQTIKSPRAPSGVDAVACLCSLRFSSFDDVRPLL